MGLHDYGQVNVRQRSNTRNYRVVIVNKMAVVIQREKLTAGFRAVLLFVSILMSIRRVTTLIMILGRHLKTIEFRKRT